MSEISASAAVEGRLGRIASYLGGRNAWAAALLLVGVPNLVFLLLAPWLLVRRLFSPFIWLVAGALALLVPWPLALIFLALASAADVFLIVVFLFDMPFATTLQSLRYLGSLDVGASLLYLAAGAFFVALPVVMTVLVVRHRALLKSASLVPAIVLAMAAGAADWKFNGFKPLTPPDFESAVGQSGLSSGRIAAGGRSLLVVMVEGFGAYASPQERDILARRLRAAAKGRYAMRSGTTAHFGSTTGATSRELCGRWGTFADYVGAGPQDCLPARLRDAGYATAAYHASYGELFSRPDWYPLIGFDTLNFREDLEAERPDAVDRLCGSVFPGLCDRQVGDIVHADLKAGTGPQFAYWLTLNSHQPYDPVPDGPLACGTGAAAIAARAPCELTEIWLDVFDKVAEIAADPDMPPLDILVVGDHNTPMWSRAGASHFINGRVDWYYLERLEELADGQTAPPPA